jgi:hypothetical protein
MHYRVTVAVLVASFPTPGAQAAVRSAAFRAIAVDLRDDGWKGCEVELRGALEAACGALETIALVTALEVVEAQQDIEVALEPSDRRGRTASSSA